MEIKYKGFDIQFEEEEDCFVAYKDGDSFAKNQSLVQLKNYLDVTLKKSFKRLPIYKFSEIKIIEGEITSFNSCEKEAWITYGKEKTREKENVAYSNCLIHKNTANLKILQQICSLTSQMDKLEKTKEELTEKLTHCTYEELCKITGENPID